MEKNNEISEDEHHDFSEEIQKLTNNFTSKADQTMKSKESEILTI